MHRRKLLGTLSFALFALSFVAFQSVGAPATTLAQSGSLEGDKAALMAFYKSTGGDNWDNNTGWGSDDPVGSWQGITVTNDRVTRLSLVGNNLTGTLPTEIGDLTALTTLNLPSNSLSGELPDSMANLTALTHVGLGDNDLSGEIPGFLGDFKGLDVLNLRDNNFSGSIPSNLGNATALGSLYIGGNPLTGGIPKTFDRLKNLRFLSLAETDLSGMVPSELGQLGGDGGVLLGISLYDTYLGGPFPASWTNLELDLFDVSGSHFCIASSDQAMLDWYKEVDGSPAALPDCVAPATPTGLDYASTTDGNGVILSWDDPNDSTVSGWETRWRRHPQWLDPGTEFNAWQFVRNTRPGTTSHTVREGIQGGHVYTFEFRAVNYTGRSDSISIDAAPGTLSEDQEALKKIYDATGGPNWTNQSGWDFDKPLSNLWEGLTVQNGRVTHIYLQDNNLTGALPTEIGDLTAVKYLNLAGNNLSGELPRSLENLDLLSFLQLSRNKFSGALPAELADMDLLSTMDLSENQLTGSIPSGLADLPHLWSIDLDDNDLSGEIPASLGGSQHLASLHFANNQLTGDIPEELANAANMQHLDFGGNDLSGGIPAALGDLDKLRTLRLKDNSLTGSVPLELTKLGNLRTLDLRGNALCVSEAETERILDWIRGIRWGDPESFPDCHDRDDDGLIEVHNKAQLDAMRYDLNGDGVVDHDSDNDAYDAAFPIHERARSCVTDGCHGYELVSDINLNQELWDPIGNLESGKWDATFRGNGYTVSHLNALSSTGKNTGLFGETTGRSIIEGVYIYSADVESYGGNNEDNRQNSAGALVGFNRGIVRESGLSYIWGDICQISGRNVSGGLVGGNEGIVERSWSNCDDINSKKSGGGLVGFNHPGGIVRDSWADGLVIVKRKGWKKGALVGRNFGTIERSFSLGQTKRDKTYHGPLTGQQGGVVTDSYFVGHEYDEKYGGKHLKDEEMRLPQASDPRFFANWDRELWHLGDKDTYSALVVDANHDGVATPWEIGRQRPSDSVNGKPVKVGDPEISRTKLTLQFRAPEGSTAAMAAVHYRIARVGNVCHDWFGTNNVLLGRSDGRAALSVDDNGLYTLVIDRESDRAFDAHKSVCVDVNFLNTEGHGYKSSQRWKNVRMPAPTPVESFSFTGSRTVGADGVALQLTLTPGDAEFSRIDGFWKRFKDEHGNNCHNPSYGYGPILPADTERGSDADDGVVKVTIPYADAPRHHSYCMYVQLWNEDGTERVRRWTKIDVP